MKIVSIKKIEIPGKDKMPDIDTDIQGERRHEVKQYFEDTYGKGFVCSIGAYGRDKLKGVIKDFSRLKTDLNFSQINYLTKPIDNQQDYSFTDLFTYANQEKGLKDYVQNNLELVNLMKFCLGQIKSEGMHASAIVVVPKQDKDGNPMEIYDWMPMKKIIDKEGVGHLVSEWEGEFVDAAGFLKEDLLGLSQLDKFDMMIKMIAKNTGDKIILEEIPLDDNKVYHLFQKGLNEDVFQFGSQGLKNYCKQVKPDVFEDLIAINALWRPGSTQSGSHTDYALIKHGKKKPDTIPLMEEITKKTHGMFVFQEQIMKAFVRVGFTIAESEKIRTIIKKFLKKDMLALEKEFVDKMTNCLIKERKVPEVKSKLIAEDTWKKLVAFSGYGFNRNHSAAYAIMGYQSQWLKSKYPLEFYTTSLNFSNDKIIPFVINEFTKRKLNLSIKTPNINISKRDFVSNPKNDSIYWSLLKIKGIGQATVSSILSERKKGGKFSSLIDFVKRTKGNGVNKSNVRSLILSGAFDEIENIKQTRERYNLIQKHCKFINEELPEEFKLPKYKNNETWILLQKEKISYGYIDYRKLLSIKNPNMAKYYVDGERFYEKRTYDKITIAGELNHLVEANSKRGKYGRGTIICNDEQIKFVIWNENWEFFKKELEEIKKERKLFAMSGIMKKDERWGDTLYSDVDFSTIIKLT